MLKLDFGGWVLILGGFPVHTGMTVWLGSIKQSNTTTDSYAAVPAVEQTVSLRSLGRPPRLDSQLCFL